MSPTPDSRLRVARFIATVLLVAAVCGALYGTLAAGGCGPSGGSDRPNVLLLVMDTTRADRCGFDGYARPTTPRLDEFANDATVFRQAWSPANYTGPAHATLFTGVRPPTHGLHGGARRHLGPALPTLAERFAAAGYDTACFTNNPLVAPEFGLSRGFMTFVPCFSDKRRASDTASWARQTHADAASWAVASRDAGRPFFLFINDIEPHMPYSPPVADADRFIRGSPSIAERVEAREYQHPKSLAYDLGRERLDTRMLELLSDLYDAEIASLDRDIGLLLDRLKADGLLDRTIVVIVGDHGESLGEHQIIGHSFGLYEGLIHVPLVIRWPGVFDKGRVVSDVVRLEDLPPTLLDLCKLPALEKIDGETLTSGLANRIARATQPPHDVIEGLAKTEFPGTNVSPLGVGIRSVFDGKRHLLAFSDGHVELYDTAADPGELTDLSAREPAEVERLRPLLDVAR